jgi:hypothetical protein
MRKSDETLSIVALSPSLLPAVYSIVASSALAATGMDGAIGGRNTTELHERAESDDSEADGAIAERVPSASCCRFMYTLLPILELPSWLRALADSHETNHCTRFGIVTVRDETVSKTLRGGDEARAAVPTSDLPLSSFVLTSFTVYGSARGFEGRGEGSFNLCLGVGRQVYTEECSSGACARASMIFPSILGAKSSE